MSQPVNVTINVYGPFGQEGIQTILDRLNDLKDLTTAMAGVELDIATSERKMSKTTDDLVAVVQGLVDNSSKVDAAIDQLVASQGDAAKTAEALTQLQTLKTDQDTHLANLATAIPPVVAAPPDTTPVTIPTPDAPAA